MLSTKLKEAAGNSADATLYVDDVFSTWLYTGNGSTQTITNGIDLAGKGGLVWTKSRSTTYPHSLVDSARGIVNGNENVLNTATTAGNTLISGMVISANSNGFTTGGAYQINENNQTYASWTFRKAAKFFDVVTWTGDGTSSQTINHSLGSIPGMIIVKVTSTSGHWAVYHRDLGNQYYLWLSSTNAKDGPNINYWNNTSPTASDFTVGANFSTAGVTYVAYLFAHDTSSTGIIQCGSFTTNVGGTGAVNLGWEPQYLMYKRTDTTENWQVFDTMRGFVSGPAVDTSDDALLIPNTSAAESTQSRGRPTATGFDAWTGFGNAPYIYMAIRRPNKPPTTGTQVFSPNVFSLTLG